MLRLKPALVAAALVSATLIVGCGQRGNDVEAAMAEISAATGASGVGATLAPVAVIDGKTYKALGRHPWTVTANGQSGNTGMEIEEFRSMIGLRSVTPAGSGRSLISINNSRPNPILDQSTATKDVGTFAGLRRVVDESFPNPGEDLILPAPYYGFIRCGPGAIERNSHCQAILKHAGRRLSVSIAPGDIKEWKPYVDGFLTLIDQAAS